MKIFVLCVVLLVFILAFASTGCTHLTGSGTKVGSVIKVSSEGLFFKTNEVEIVRGGMNGGSGSFSTTPLNGTVTDDAVLAQLRDALNNQYEVEVQYRDYLWTPISSDSASRYIVAVHKLDPVKQAVNCSQTNVEITNPEIEIKDGAIVIKNKN